MRSTHWGGLQGIAAGLVALVAVMFVGVPRAVGEGHDAAPRDPEEWPAFALTLEEATAVPTTEAEPLRSPADVAQPLPALAEKDEQIEEYDPWEPFNDKTFWFNRKFDRYLLKPVATGYDAVVPHPVQTSLKNALTNVGVARRLVNNLLQLNMPGAGREVGRFLINSTLGVAGFFDVAKSWFGLEKSDRDTGQTFGVWGMGQGPYLVLPLLPPLTLRDGVGFAFDVALDPLLYFAPFAALAGRTGATVVNDRSQNLEFYENAEETTLDVYSAVRNGYLQRRAKVVEEARAPRSAPALEMSVEIRPVTE